MVEKSSIHDDAIKKKTTTDTFFEECLHKACRQNIVVSGYEGVANTTLSLYNVLVPQYCVFFLQYKSMEFCRFDHHICLSYWLRKLRKIDLNCP